MNCTECGLPLAKNAKYLAVFRSGTDGQAVRIEAGCKHFTPDNLESAIAILNGRNCAQLWFHYWMYELDCRDHIDLSGGSEKEGMGKQHESAESQEIDGLFMLPVAGKGQTAEMPENKVGTSLPLVGLNQPSKQATPTAQIIQRGRKQCTKESPMPKGDTGRWLHDNTREVGHQEDGWPGGDIVKIECLNCGLVWKEELPQ